MEGVTAFLARSLYGTGMRLMEGLRLRVNDVDFDRQVIIVREAKGNEDRVVMLRSLAPALQKQMMASRSLEQTDRQAQRAGVQVPLCAGREIPAPWACLGLMLVVPFAYFVC